LGPDPGAIASAAGKRGPLLARVVYSFQVSNLFQVVIGIIHRGSKMLSPVFGWTVFVSLTAHSCQVSCKYFFFVSHFL